jgi:hypothetical protein
MNDTGLNWLQRERKNTMLTIVRHNFLLVEQTIK